jgi:hypothetical protein
MKWGAKIRHRSFYNLIFNIIMDCLWKIELGAIWNKYENTSVLVEFGEPFLEFPFIFDS